MSDQGERGARWTEMNEQDGPTGSRPQQPHDVWGKIEEPAQRIEPKTVPEPGYEPLRPAPDEEEPAGPLFAAEPEVPARRPRPPARELPAADDDEPASGAGGEACRTYEIDDEHEAPTRDERVYDADDDGGPGTGPLFAAEPEVPARRPAVRDEPAPAASPASPASPAPAEPAAEDGVRVAPAAEQPAWEGSLFDGEDGGSAAADSRYVAPTGDHGPGKSGKPSSGNWQMPDWMADENAADAKLGVQGSLDDAGSGRSRLMLFGGVGLLAVAVLAAGGVYFVTKSGDSAASSDERRSATARTPAQPKASLPPDKPLRRFAGTPDRVLGFVKDPMSGLSYPRFAAPWQTPNKKNKLAVSGWSGQQIKVTERRAGQIWYGQFLTGLLSPSLQDSYQGPESARKVAALVAADLEAQYYGFQHRTVPLASQELTVGARKGWLVASYLTYKRPPFKATGEVVATAVIDTGKDVPAVAFASMPNTERKAWPDVNEFFGKLRAS
ncbi:hypothetical protein [Actinomadura parmotrematis]|uniref:Uncharacterized protein n=1 Tax=Actinomadura parmotrematis TaxID=2864039 RepID=A0ABS7G4C9_9ACTN|nr:hypothetical protein [Actinomadura parmotrematis]MBW8487562.1 hypothetical protein [Actinomadura parmotrematis]